MADPILADFFKVQAVFQHVSGLPEDRFVNNWVFRNNGQLADSIGSRESMADRTQKVLTAFYAEAEPATGRSIASYLSPALTATLELRTYDLGQAPPREAAIRKVQLPARSPAGYPAEVAAVLTSFAGRNLPRRRGRIFLGPLGTGTGTMTSDGRVRLDGNFMETVLGRGLNVMRSSIDVSWCMLSQADAQAFVIDNLWMDDSFDTQRRRGEKAGDRRTRKK